MGVKIYKIICVVYIMLCSNTKLNKFSLDHFNYINQIFGDQTVRGIISNVFSNRKYGFRIEKTIKDSAGNEISKTYIDDEDDDDDYDKEDDENKIIELHHILYKNDTNGTKKRKKTITKTLDNVCSYANGHQDNTVNINDTLCQSYSLLTYFDIPIHPDQKQRQMDMIKLYRHILQNTKFRKEFNNLKIDNTWGIYDENDNLVEYIELTTEQILEKLWAILNDWENFGYLYFIGNGTCPRPAVSPSPMVGLRPTTRSAVTKSKPNTRLQNSSKKTRYGGNTKTKTNKRTTKNKK